MAVQDKSVHLEADYRNLARILPSLPFPKDVGSKRGCHQGEVRRQPQRRGAPGLTPQGTCNHKSLSPKVAWASDMPFGLHYLYTLPLRRVCRQVWFTRGFLWKLSGTSELEDFTRRKVMLRKPSARESSWTLRGRSEI